ncbi:MAG: hypothetical protein ACREP8_16810, partial [Candidatus Binatia bacterium]
VIAIIVVLASIFLPLAFNKLQRADEASSDASIQEIAAALTAFYDDVRHFPTCNGADCSPVVGTVNDLRFLAFGTGDGDISGEYPSAVAAWNFATNGETTAEKNNGFNHLVQNDPNGSGATDGSDYDTAGGRRWRGPYLSRVGADPWGRAFIVHVGAMETGGCPVGSTGVPPACTAPATGTRGWILSAGPDNSLDTSPSANSLGTTDDRGFIFNTQ